jgi:tRNA(Ile)-lysidine synthase
MLQKFKTHIQSKFAFLENKKVLIAISGGLDSVVLHHLFHQLKSVKIALAHCNFRLRGGESDLDEKFVEKLSQKTSNQIFTIKFNTEEYAKKNKVSTQIAARELRYNWFTTLLQEHKFDYVATAHHANDNFETFLINLTRGSGLEGFTGIPEINDTIIRPLLPFSRADILKYAQKNNIEWREDASNASVKYTRNKIRHQIIPILKEINPSILDSFSNTIAHLKESQQIIEDRIAKISKEIISVNLSDDKETIHLDIEKINQLSNPKAYLYQFLKEYHFTEWNDIYNLLTAQSGKQVFSKTHRLLKDRDYLILSQKNTSISTTVKEPFTIENNQSELKIPLQLSIKNVLHQPTANKKIIYVDKDLLKYPLIVRKWKNGDYIYPKGMQGKKKLSKYFKDEKFSLIQKENTWLLCNGNDDIIWVIQHRQDRRFSASKNTKNTLQISLT